MLVLTARGSAAAEKAEAVVSSAPDRKPASASGAPCDDARIEAAVLECVAGVAPAIGVGKVVEVVAGSKSSWIERSGASELPCYGVVSCDRKRVTEIIHDMIRRGLLNRTADSRYPVLELASAGEDALQRHRADQELPSARA